MHYEYSPNDYDDKYANVITKMCNFKKALQITCKLYVRICTARLWRRSPTGKKARPIKQAFFEP